METHQTANRTLPQCDTFFNFVYQLIKVCEPNKTTIRGFKIPEIDCRSLLALVIGVLVYCLTIF